MISVIVPVLNESAVLPDLLRSLRELAASGAEVIAVDGGSSDGTREALEKAGVRVLLAQRGRARQMNAGAAQASGDQLLFLHADTRLPPNGLAAVSMSLLPGRPGWGRFDVCIDGRSRWLPLIALMINQRSRLTGIATGDQALFMRREVYEAMGGFPDQPLMEDVELCTRLRRRFGWPACLRDRVVTSGRRWDTRGVWPTILLMWALRWAYWRGVPAQQLAARYR